MGDQMKQMGLSALKYLAEECRADAMDILEYRRIAYDVKGIPSVIKDYRMPTCFEEDCMQYAYDHVDLKKGDVLIASFPKTGTTWVQTIVNHILHGNNPDDLEKYSALRRFFFYLEFGPVKKYDIWKKLSFPQQVFATHLPVSLVNLDKYRKNGAKVMCTIRNPKDQMVSWRSFLMSFPCTKMDHWKSIAPEDEKQFYDVLLAGKQYTCTKEGEGYLNCLKEWYQYKDDENFLFVVYEELRKHAKREIKKMADFIGHPLSEEDLDILVRKTTLEAMKETYGKEGLDSSAGVSFIKKGHIGKWKNHLTVAQSEFVDRKVKEILGDTDIKFIYE